MPILYVRKWDTENNCADGYDWFTIEAIETELPSNGHSATGYGNRIATQYKAKYKGRWRRVYMANYGNAGTAYIGKPGAWELTVESVMK